jgi:hypothetical protein
VTSQRVELKNAPEIKRVILAAFPNYRKKTASFSAFSESGQNINSYWDGGSRDYYAVVELATMKRGTMPSSSHPYFDVARYGMANKEDGVVKVDHVGNVTLKVLPEGFALVQTGVFCGKEASAHVYFNPANLAKLLPAA